MKLFATLALLLLVAACGGGDDVASDPAPTTSPSNSAGPPTSAPVSAGQVATRGLVTVIDSGAGPQMCLGPVTMIYPPQCGGPALVGWDWKGLGRGMSEQEGGTRWGSYALTGTWDGSALSVTDAVPAALYDALPEEPAPAPTQGTDLLPAELERIASEVREVPGVTDAVVVDGQVLADAKYDDGSLQAWADAAYGAGVVVIASALVDVG